MRWAFLFTRANAKTSVNLAKNLEKQINFMTAQQVGLITDSTSDLPQSVAFDKWNIIVVPAFINWGTESYADDGVQITEARILPSAGNFARYTAYFSHAPGTLRCCA